MPELFAFCEVLIEIVPGKLYMAGAKRKVEDMEEEQSVGHVSPFLPRFEFFRAELDEHHDRRERIIKASRDITALSKKIIFALQRVRELGRPIHASVTKQTAPMYSTIQSLMESVVPDLQGTNAQRYHSSITGGIQEYMEAVLFQHYLETQCLLSHEEAARKLVSGLQLTHDDYLLGVFDMTGELMRFAITYMATNAKLRGASSADESILADMQNLRSLLESLDASGSRSLKDFDSKIKVTRQSVEKVENGVYSMLVRGKERPKGWRPDTDLAGGGGPAEIQSY